MPVVNPLARELVFKVVYYGPGLGGKTTSLQHIHATTKAEHRGKMVSLATPVDRTLYFDFLPIRVPTAHDMTVRLQLFTVPGQVYYNATRKLVLTGADGVVFVVDSQRARADANIESLRNLEENLIEHGRALDEIPHVFSYNKRDLPGLVPIDDMERLLNPRGAPSFATVATSGEGVYETLEAITRAVLEDFEQRMPEHRGLAPSPLMLPEGGLAEALRMAEVATPAATRPTSASRGMAQDTDPQAQDVIFTLPQADDSGEQAARVLAESGARNATEALDVPVPGKPAPDVLVQDKDLPIELSRPKRLPTAMATAAPDPSIHALESLTSSTERHSASPVEFMSKVVATLASGRPKSNVDSGWEFGAQSLEARVDTRTMISDVAPARGDALQPPESTASRFESATPASVKADVAVEPSSRSSFSLSSLWSDEESSTVIRIEEAITSGDYRDAVLLVDVLVQRCLEAFGVGLGEPVLEPSVLLLLVGMHGESVLEFRRLCVRSRTTATSVTEDDAKFALIFATQLRLLSRRARH